MKIAILVIIVLLIFTVIIGWIQGEKTVVENFEIDNDKTDEQITFVQLTDIHSMTSEKRRNELIEMVNEIKPDVILLTGDIIDQPTDQTTIKMIEQFNVKDIFYISGNHEFDNGDIFYEQVKQSLQDIGVTVLDNESVLYKDKYNIIGVKDYYGASFFNNKNDKYYQTVDEIDELIKGEVKEDKINILLMHRPQYFPDLDTTGVDYIFSGHVHGGQWQAPFNLFSALAPDQGLFPKYFEGQYVKDETILFVSPGLEREYNLPRFYNPRKIYEIKIY